ncbi:hypothetical protein J5751_00835 [bacterium]|nr:hypothetical protein [bacterium]
MKKIKSQISASAKFSEKELFATNCAHCKAEVLSRLIQTLANITWMNLLQSIGSPGNSQLPPN